MRAALVAVLVAIAIAPAPSDAGALARACRDAGVDAAVCGAALAAETALERPGASADDFTADDVASVRIADFYFAPRVSIVRNRQTVTFINVNPPGGNRHSVISSDWGGTQPVLPIPVVGFGGGVAFRSGKLGPGEPFTVVADVAALDPAASVLLPNGDALIGYHCYIHGSAQMSGVLVVRGAAA